MKQFPQIGEVRRRANEEDGQGLDIPIFGGLPKIYRFPQSDESDENQGPKSRHLRTRSGIENALDLCHVQVRHNSKVGSIDVIDNRVSGLYIVLQNNQRVWRLGKKFKGRKREKKKIWGK